MFTITSLSRLYCWSAQWKDDVAPPEFKAFAIVSAVMVGHAILFVQLVELIFGFRIIALLPNYSVYVAAMVFAVPNYFILLYRHRYKKIISSFAPEPPQVRKRRERAIWIYIYLVAALSFLCAIISKWR